MGYSIDGFFMTQRPTGTHRYAYEILKELDKQISDSFDVEIVFPNWFNCDIGFKNIKIIHYGRLKGIPWEQIDFAFYLVRNKREGLFLNNVFSIIAPRGIIAIHDICYKRHPEFYRSPRDKISMLWHRLNYYCAVHSKMKIFTVSQFSQKEIQVAYKLKEKRIDVINGSWQHIKRIKESTEVFDKYPILNNKSGYYFSVSTLGANKNFKWILYAANNNRNELFVIAGGGKLKGADEAVPFVELPNIIFLGYIEDSEIKALMARCKGFLFPTLYEGFGLTPMEAIACGAKNVYVSDIPCMKEVYGNSVNYIDPNNYEFKFNNLSVRFSNQNDFLDRYSWTESSKKLLNLIV